jgi:hypothetical protein
MRKDRRRASVSRAAELRRSESTRSSSTNDDEVGGYERDARAGRNVPASVGIARRRAEEE